jgi:hypothetical protein
MASTPEFVKTPRINTVNVSSANTAIDGSGTITELIAGATGGTRVLEIVVKGAATSAAANINIFLTTDGGTTYRLFDTISVTAVTTGNTTPTFRGRTAYTNLVLASSSHRVGITTTIAQSTNVIALGGDLA